MFDSESYPGEGNEDGFTMYTKAFFIIVCALAALAAAQARAETISFSGYEWETTGEEGAATFEVTGDGLVITPAVGNRQVGLATLIPHEDISVRAQVRFLGVPSNSWYWLGLWARWVEGGGNYFGGINRNPSSEIDYVEVAWDIPGGGKIAVYGANPYALPREREVILELDVIEDQMHFAACSVDPLPCGEASLTDSQATAGEALGLYFNASSNLVPVVIRWIEIERRVDIDIRPGSDSNPIRRSGRGNLPVAILGSETFDAMNVDGTTLAFGPDAAGPSHDLTKPGLFEDHLRDVNGDGFTDLVSHYRTQETGISRDDAEACITGDLLDGTPFEGCDTIRVVARRSPRSRR